MYNQRYLRERNSSCSPCSVREAQGVCLPVPRGLWKDNPFKEQNKASLTTQTVSDRSQPLTMDFTRQHNETVGCFIYDDANLKGLCLCITSCRPVVNHSSMFLWPRKEVQHKKQLVESFYLTMPYLWTMVRSAIDDLRGCVQWTTTEGLEELVFMIQVGQTKISNLNELQIRQCLVLEK